MTTAAELKQKDTEELRALVAELREEGFRLRMQHHTGQLDKVSRLSQTRRDVARILTILRQRELADKE